MWVEPRLLSVFATWSQRLQVFREVTSSTERGCLLLRQPERARPPFGVLDDRCPTLSVIYHNISNGWKGVRGRVTHTTPAIGEFDEAEAIKWKGYHQCLAQIGKTLTLTSAMPSRELVAYYKLLLRNVKTEPGLTNKEYIVLLNKNKRLHNEDIELIPLEDGVLDGGEDGIMTPAPVQPAAPKPKRESAPPGRLRPSGGSRGSTDPPPPIVDVDPGGGGGDPGPGGPDDDGIVTSVPRGEDDDGIAAGPSVQADKRGTKKESVAWVLSLDTCHVAYRDYPTPSGVRYQNWKLLCPTHPGMECIKTKGCLPKLLHLYGEIGPLAFLHAWALTDPAPDRTHVNTEPSTVDVKKYAESHAEELREVLGRAQAAAAATAMAAESSQTNICVTSNVFVY